MMRVIPRDLFNDGNLLKCYGKLYIELERYGLENCLEHYDEDEQFIIEQLSDGQTYISNIALIINGDEVDLFRPSNSRDPWPLYADVEDDHIYVFDNFGNFTKEFKQLIGCDL